MLFQILLQVKLHYFLASHFLDLIHPVPVVFHLQDLYLQLHPLQLFDHQVLHLLQVIFLLQQILQPLLHLLIQSFLHQHFHFDLILRLILQLVLVLLEVQVEVLVVEQQLGLVVKLLMQFHN